mmetsp:Transcript_13809/g.35480  ORF Transcript_13809/g.35480 Transcript_13809/m.35480 type:complete len:237 (-) Transcript_13809:544-1254(-)
MPLSSSLVKAALVVWNCESSKLDAGFWGRGGASAPAPMPFLAWLALIAAATTPIFLSSIAADRRSGGAFTSTRTALGLGASGLGGGGAAPEAAAAALRSAAVLAKPSAPRTFGLYSCTAETLRYEPGAHPDLSLYSTFHQPSIRFSLTKMMAFLSKDTSSGSRAVYFCREMCLALAAGTTSTPSELDSVSTGSRKVAGIHPWLPSALANHHPESCFSTISTTVPAEIDSSPLFFFL